MQLNTKKYDAFVRTFSIMRTGVRLIAIERFKIETTKKLHTSKTFLKTAGGRMCNNYAYPSS